MPFRKTTEFGISQVKTPFVVGGCLTCIPLPLGAHCQKHILQLYFFAGVCFKFHLWIGFPERLAPEFRHPGSRLCLRFLSAVDISPGLPQAVCRPPKRRPHPKMVNKEPPAGDDRAARPALPAGPRPVLPPALDGGRRRADLHPLRPGPARRVHGIDFSLSGPPFHSWSAPSPNTESCGALRGGVEGGGPGAVVNTKLPEGAKKSKISHT